MTIDHTAYPGILDSILSQSSTLTLFRLRATCRMLRDRADALLLHHAVLASDKSTHPAKVKLTTPAGEPLPMRPELVRVLDEPLPCMGCPWCASVQNRKRANPSGACKAKPVWPIAARMYLKVPCQCRHPHLAQQRCHLHLGFTCPQ